MAQKDSFDTPEWDEEEAQKLPLKERAEALFQQAHRLSKQGKVCESERFYGRAAEAGSLKAMQNLANCLRARGDVTAAFDATRQAADLGLAAAQHSMGLCYNYGEGVPVNYEQAAMWYRRSADQGLAASKTSLACLLEKGLGIAEPRPQAAFALFQEAAELGNAVGTYNLARCHKFGVGTPVSYEKALAGFVAGAKQGQVDCLFQLGCAYSQGECGVAPNPSKAVKIYRLAADAGHTLSQSNLGWCYAHAHGTDPDFQQASRYYLAAARGGDVRAQVNLAGLLLTGAPGVKSDLQGARHWYGVAAAQGCVDAQVMVERIKEGLNPAPLDFKEPKEPRGELNQI